MIHDKIVDLLSCKIRFLWLKIYYFIVLDKSQKISKLYKIVYMFTDD